MGYTGWTKQGVRNLNGPGFNGRRRRATKEESCDHNFQHDPNKCPGCSSWASVYDDYDYAPRCVSHCTFCTATRQE